MVILTLHVIVAVRVMRATHVKRTPLGVGRPNAASVNHLGAARKSIPTRRG
jgi:hypothetical protein